jgi:hypothetical protein
MRPRNSDMFEIYAKLAEEKGLVKTAAEEHKAYRDSVQARNSSADISTIEALYGVKPEAIEGMEYERNIIEIAHPEPVVIADAYDKLNGLVENINETHNIIINKVRSKAPSGTPNFAKEAKKALTMELIRIANDMDNADQEDLRILADDCIGELKKKAAWYDTVSDLAHKAVDAIGGSSADRFVNDVGGVGEGALAGAAVGAGVAAILGSWTGPGEIAIIPAGAVVGALAGYLLNTSPKIKNIKENAKELLSQLEDVKKAVPSEASFFAQMEESLHKLDAASDKYLAAINLTQSKSMKNEEPSPEEVKAVKDASEEFKKAITIDKLFEIFETKNKMGLFAAAKGTIFDEVKDVEESFSSLKVAVDRFVALMGGITNKAKADIKEEKTEEKPKDKETAKPGMVPQSEDAMSAAWKAFHSLTGTKPNADGANFLDSLK